MWQHSDVQPAFREGTLVWGRVVADIPDFTGRADELAALEPTDLPVDNAGSCHSSAVKARPQPSHPRGGCFAARRHDHRFDARVEVRPSPWRLGATRHVLTGLDDEEVSLLGSLGATGHGGCNDFYLRPL